VQQFLDTPVPTPAQAIASTQAWTAGEISAVENNLRDAGVWLAANIGLLLIAALGIYLAFHAEINQAVTSTVRTAGEVAAA
jgi:hypothetical protein